jgi:hypothetical protein
MNNQFRDNEMIMSPAKKTGLMKAVSQTINMTQGGVAILSREPNTVQLLNSHQVKSGLIMDPNSQQSQGNYTILQLCQIVPALQDVYRYWKMLVNLTGPGPYSRKDARVIYMLHQQLGEKALEDTDVALKGLMIVSAEENIGAHMDRISQLFLNIIALYESALKFTRKTWDAIHEMRRRLEQYLGEHEFGAPHGKSTEAMYLKAIYVFCMDVTFLIRSCLDNSVFTSEDAWLAAIARLPDLKIGSVMQDLHQSLTIAVSVAAIEDKDRKKPRNPKKRGSQELNAGLDTPNKGQDNNGKAGKNKDEKIKKGKGICFKALTTAGCQFGDKCKYDHADPKPSEYGAVKEYILKNDFVVRVGVKLE